MAPDAPTPEPPARARRLRYPLYLIFLTSYTIVHLKFELDYWTTDHLQFFAKYALADSAEEAFFVAKKVYYTKATWMIALVWMQAAGLRFREALSCSFVLYALELALLFPLRLYTGLNMLLALGFAAESLAARRREAP
ncbi:MAG: hypothetical protein H6713_18220 [Myxococcales bacterium]|nr:hypothetical protein [Myxococcales bacterium]